MPIDLNDDDASRITRQPKPRVARRECPCGADAIWCRKEVAVIHDASGETVVELDTETAAYGVRRITGNDLYEDLCNDCFEEAVPATERGQWQRIA